MGNRCDDRRGDANGPLAERAARHTGSPAAAAAVLSVMLGSTLLGLGGCALARISGPAVDRAVDARPIPGRSPGASRAEVGLASWYGGVHQGRPTASGEIFDMRQLTAAHRTLPLGTRLRVANLENGRIVRVRVNDRGPYVTDRILDLSYGAARALDMVERGVARVRLEITEEP